MRASRTLTALLASLLCLAAQGAIAADSLEEILARNIQARGGLERWLAVTSLRVSGVVVQDGNEITVVQENKRPNRVRNEFTLQGMTGIQAYDGSAGWQVIPFGGRKDPEALSADDMKELVEAADLEGPLVDWRKKGHKLDYLGIEAVDGTPAHKLRITRSNGDVQWLYLDAEHFLEIRIENRRSVRGADVENEIDLGNYEAVEGLMLPFSYESGPKGSGTRQKLRVTRVEVNLPLDDARFGMPRTGPPAASSSGPR